MCFTTRTAVSYCFLFLFLVGGSNDDRLNSTDEIFMSAKIDGIEHYLNSGTSSFTARRIIGASGLLQLEVRGISEDGQSVKFTIPAYSGKNQYTIGDNYILPNTIEYSRISPYGTWYCGHPGANESDKNYVEIISDDGQRLEGKFSFTGLNPDDNSSRKVTEGKFKVYTD